MRTVLFTFFFKNNNKKICTFHQKTPYENFDLRLIFVREKDYPNSQTLCKIYRGICMPAEQGATLQKPLIFEGNYNRADPLRDFEEE